MMTRSSTLTKSITVTAILAVLISVGLYLWLSRTEPMTTFTDDTIGISLNYASILKADTLDNQAKADNVVLRLINKNESPVLSTVRYETGLREVSQLTRVTTFDLISGNISRGLPARYPSYERITSENVTVAGHQAYRIVFRYHKDGEAPVMQELLAIVKDDDTAIYISHQAAEAHFEVQHTHYFEPINSSLRLF